MNIRKQLYLVILIFSHNHNISTNCRILFIFERQDSAVFYTCWLVCKCTCLLCTLESLQPMLLLSHLETCFSSTELHQCFHWELQSKLFCFHFAIFRENWSLFPDNLALWLQISTFLFHGQCLCFWHWESKLWYLRSWHLEHHLKKSESSSKEI